MTRARREAKRERYKRRVPRWYSPELHLAAIVVSAAFAVALMLRDVANFGGVRLAALFAVPATLIMTLVLEYRLHRGPMHKRRRLGDRMFVQHTLHHHRYFDHAQMGVGSRRDLYFVIFRVEMPLAVFAGTFVGYMVLRATLGADVAMIAGTTAIAHYLALEFIHLLTHLPSPWFRRWPLRLAIFRRLREHHRLHHDVRLMRKHNFSITAPLVDAVMGTRIRAQPEEPGASLTARIAYEAPSPGQSDAHLAS